MAMTLTWPQEDRHVYFKWSEFVAADPEVLVRFPALKDFLSSSGSRTRSTGFTLRRLLRLAGLRWGYSNPVPTWRARAPYKYPPGKGWYTYTPGHWVPFTSPLTTRRATVGVF
jgi:hypothetical protein